MSARYELQVKRPYGWTKAGNWPARTLTEAFESMDRCSTLCTADDGTRGDERDYRVVQLVAKVMGITRANLRFDEKRQVYVRLKK